MKAAVVVLFLGACILLAGTAISVVVSDDHDRIARLQERVRELEAALNSQQREGIAARKSAADYAAEVARLEQKLQRVNGSKVVAVPSSKSWPEICVDTEDHYISLKDQQPYIVSHRERGYLSSTVIYKDEKAVGEAIQWLFQQGAEYGHTKLKNGQEVLGWHHKDSVIDPVIVYGKKLSNTEDGAWYHGLRHREAASYK